MRTEEILIYTSVLILCVLILYIYLRKLKFNNKIIDQKISKAIEQGIHEPVSLHPVINPDNCIQSGACIKACPETDIIGIKNGLATIINASRCVGHGACFHACPVEAITLAIGTEKRGVDLPHVDQNFESNVPGIYIAGEMGGMGLIKNSVEQGRQAVENITKKVQVYKKKGDFDLIIVGAGPAGISASLTAKKNGIRFMTLEQDTLGGTVFSFPRSKIVMTAPMNLPLFGNIKLFETSKSELISLWKKVLTENNIQITENTKVESIENQEEYFFIKTNTGREYTANNILLAIGRRGSPRKLNIPGENKEKVTYRLLEPEHFNDKKIIVIGGGDSAIESALLLADQNEVILSYRGDSFNRIKPKNQDRILEAAENKSIDVRFNTEVSSIHDNYVMIKNAKTEEISKVQNDQVFILAGGELPTQFLEKAGIKITKRFGHTILSHKK